MQGLIPKDWGFVSPRHRRVGRPGHRQNGLGAGAPALGRAAAAGAADGNGGARRGGIGAAGGFLGAKMGTSWDHHGVMGCHGIFGSCGAGKTARMSVRFHQHLTAIHSQQDGHPVFFPAWLVSYHCPKLFHGGRCTWRQASSEVRTGIDVIRMIRMIRILGTFGRFDGFLKLGIPHNHPN